MNSREIILEILLEIENKKSYSNLTINSYLNKYNLKKDENLIRKIVYGVLENRDYIDYIIRKKSTVRLKKIDSTILMILRIGCYQICFLDNIPDSAAVNESVKLVKVKKLNKYTGFVNGILRNIARDIDNVMKIEDKTDMEYLSIKYSHPLWLVEKYINDFGYDFTKDILKANNENPYLNIRVNSLKITRDDLMVKLKEYGFNVEKTKYANFGIIIYNPRRITELNEYKEGYFTIQDESSMLVAEIMDPSENSLVLDISAAPGGKTTNMGELMNNSGKIIARDIFSHKLKLIEENAKRLGIDIIKTELYDGLKLDNTLVDKVDYCLVDVPCSALGNIRRSPEIKYFRTMEDIENIIKTQRELLEIASKYLKISGKLIYSTCTINRDENINIIMDFLNDNKNYKLEPIVNENLDTELFPTVDKGYIEIYSNIQKIDGFFIAQLIKIA